MNNIRTMTINDPFRAAFLLKYGRYKETRIENGQQCYVIEGDAQTLSERDFCFRTGCALVDPLALREAFFLLKELSSTDADDIELEEMSEPLDIEIEEENHEQE